MLLLALLLLMLRWAQFVIFLIMQELIRRQQEIKEARKVLAGDEEGVEDMADM